MGDRSRNILLLLAMVLLASCAGLHRRKADKAYALMAYDKASRHYAKVTRRPAAREVLLRAADAQRRRNHMEQAVSLYARAEDMAPLEELHAFRYGQVLMGLGEHTLAKDLFMRILLNTPENRHAMDLYGSCEGYRTYERDTARFTVEEVDIRGLRSVFSAVPYDGGLLVTGQRDGGPKDPWVGGGFLDLYRVPFLDNAPNGPARPVRGKVNGPYHEGPAVLSADGRTMYFTRSNYYGRKLRKDEANVSHLKLFRATLDSDGEWGDIHEFRYNNEGWSVGHPALSADGRTLYFASDMPGGYGGTDLWRCVDNGQGWGTPENLGPTVNSPGNELFPVVNGSVLHFSSNGHENFGGLDIFETYPVGARWAEPRNMMAPINSPQDDHGLSLGTDARSGYFSSDRSGVDRVMRFTMRPPEMVLEGVVVDVMRGEFLPGVEVVLVPMDGRDPQSVFSDQEGRFNFALRANTEYTVKAAKDGVFTRTGTINTAGHTVGGVLKQQLDMRTFEVGKAIRLENIYYDYDKWDIRPDAARELDQLAATIRDNPDLRFELGSHTDSRGADMYNLVLSDARARSAVNYLVQAGVDPDRLKARGYGETSPVNACVDGVHCTEEDHAANRRTEFTVVSRTDGISGVR